MSTTDRDHDRIDDLVRQIVTHAAQARKNGQRLRNAIERDKRGGTTDIDGYPTSSGVAGPGAGAAITVDGERVPVTGVEASVFARTASWAGRDELHQYTELARAHLVELVGHLNAFSHFLDKIDALGAGSNDPGCESCARITLADGKPAWAAPFLTSPTTAGQRLTTPTWLCRACYDFVNRESRLPTDAELAPFVHHGRRLRTMANTR